MKCPECGHNQKVKYGLKCGGCQYQFSFNPKVSKTSGLTDGKFVGCIRAASQNDTAYFTRNQLYAVYCRRLAGNPWSQIVISVVVFCLAGGLAVAQVWPFAFFASLFGLALLVGGITALLKKTPLRQFNSVLDQWLRDGKKIPRLIDEPTLHEPPPDWNEPDLYDYGVERLLIVEREILVDLFVKNGLHAEHRMLVISESGYPEYLMPLAARLLEEQPDLPVFLLHDATSHGAAMEHRVQAAGLLSLDGHAVTDLGMFPTDFRKLKRTRRFDPENERRDLPVDAMVLPFMTMGLGAAMTGGMAFGAIIDQQRRSSTSGSVGYDFG